MSNNYNRRFSSRFCGNGKNLILVFIVFLLISFVSFSSVNLIELIARKLRSDELSEHTSLIGNETFESLDSHAQVRHLLQRSDYTSRRNFSEPFIQRFLDARNGDAFETVKLIEKYIKHREESPELFFNTTTSYAMQRPPVSYFQRERNQAGGRIMYIKLSNWDFDKITYAEALATALPFHELDSLSGGNKAAGTTVIDLRGWSLSHVLAINLKTMRKGLDLLDSLPINDGDRVHILYQNWLFDTVYSLGKSFMPEKQVKSTIFYGDNLLALYEELPKKLLPKVIGGENDLRVYEKEELEAMDEQLRRFWSHSPGSA